MTNLLTLTPAEFCAVTQACAQGRDFAVLYPTMAEVWYNCPRPEWLLWVCDKIGQRPDDRTLRLFAVWCARNTPLGDGRVTGDLIRDPRSLAALEVAERHAHGQASDAELDAAYAATYAAANAAYADASAAAYAAARAAAYDADTNAAARAAQADQFRRMVPNPFRS